MVQFNELKIVQNNKCFIIDVSIKPLTIYSDVYIDSIVIDTQDTYVENGPSNNPIYKYTVDKDTNSKEAKHTRLILSDKDIDLSNNLLFVYVIATGTPAPSTPCGMDNSISIMPIFNTNIIYQQSMKYIRSIESNCDIPKQFIDYILRIKALELALNTGNYLLAIKYWNKFFKNIFTQESINTCNCYGKTI